MRQEEKEEGGDITGDLVSIGRREFLRRCTQVTTGLHLHRQANSVLTTVEGRGETILKPSLGSHRHPVSDALRHAIADNKHSEGERGALGAAAETEQTTQLSVCPQPSNMEIEPKSHYHP